MDFMMRFLQILLLKKWISVRAFRARTRKTGASDGLTGLRMRIIADLLRVRQNNFCFLSPFIIIMYYICST